MINKCDSRASHLPSHSNDCKGIISMTIYTNTPYTYRIGWSKTGMNYYGVRFAKNCHPSDLFVTYFTSSEYVAAYIKKHGNPDIIEVRNIFTDEHRVNRAILHEHRVLKRMNAINRPDYLNKHDGKAVNLSDPDVHKKLMDGIKRGNERPSTKVNRKSGALKSWQDPEVKQRRVASFNTPEAKAKYRASMELSYMDPEANARRSAACVEINARPEVLKANKERFLGKTFEELFGEDRAKEMKALQSDGMTKRWASGEMEKYYRYGDENPMSRPEVVALISGSNHYNYDHTVYRWQNKETGQIVEMTRQDFARTYDAKLTNVHKLLKGDCKSCRGFVLVK
jgi:hypothetical protein